MGPNWTWRVRGRADQSSIQLGVSLESRIDGSKYSRAAKVGQGKGDLQFIIRIGRVVTEVEISEEDEVVELFWVGTVKSVRFLSSSSMIRWLIFTMAEFVSHEEDSLR